MNPIQISAILGRVATKSDGSLSLTFSTSEMNAEECTVLFKLTRIELVMLLTPKRVTLEAPVEVKGELSTKTQAQRIRGVLFCLFSSLAGEGKMEGKTFEEFYQRETNRVIEGWKAQLPET